MKNLQFDPTDTNKSDEEHTMNDQQPTMNNSSHSTNAGEFDFNALRLPTNYGEGFGVKKMTTRVPVGRLDKMEFFRVHSSPDYRFKGMILVTKEHSETFLLTPEMGGVLPRLCRAVQLHAAIDRDNNISLIPVPLPNEEGIRNPWHESLALAVVEAENQWIRLEANQRVGSYNIVVPVAKLPDPEWPDMPMEEILKIAFRDRIITSVDHPVVQKLMGAI